MKSNNSYIERIRGYKQLFEYKQTQLEKVEKEKDEIKESLDKIIESKDKLDNLNYACKLILEKITHVSKIKLELFLTGAVKRIFSDRNYEIKLVLKEDTKKPGLELTLVENGIEQEITDSVGGGIISTLGLLLQIYYIEVYNLNKILFIDEGLKEVSTGINATSESVNYLENLLVFLKWLANEKKYALVIITHDNTIKKFADRIYSVEKGLVKLC